MAERSPQSAEEADDPPVELCLDLPSFEGPMDLLLELVRSREIDIFEIPIAAVTDEYLACIERMEELDLEVGADWLEMAARLTYIKSRTLLPDDDEEDGEQEGPDPREELVRRLIEYERFKTYAEKLEDRPALQGDVFESSSSIEQFRRQTGPPDVRNADVSDLLDAVRRLVDTADDDGEFVYEMTREKLSLRTVILDIADRLEDQSRITFESIFSGAAPDRNRLVTVFVALLEMTRLNMIALFQAKLGDVDTLYIERAVVDIVDVSQSLDLPDQPGEELDPAAPEQV